MIGSLGYRVCWSQDVYKPSDDTLLLMRAIDKLSEEGLLGERAVDVGSGTGILSLHMLFKGVRRLLAVDINPTAIASTWCTLSTNLSETGSWSVVRCDLLTCLRDGSLFDTIVFNPPYLPGNGRKASWIELAWDGGPSGLEVLTRLLDYVGEHGLARRVVFVVSSLAGEALEKLFQRLPQHRVMAVESFFFERLYAVEAVYD